jgi:hypothetical protein
MGDGGDHDGGGTQCFDSYSYLGIRGILDMRHSAQQRGRQDMERQREEEERTKRKRKSESTRARGYLPFTSRVHLFCWPLARCFESFSKAQIPMPELISPFYCISSSCSFSTNTSVVHLPGFLCCCANRVVSKSSRGSWHAGTQKGRPTHVLHLQF